MPKAKARKAEIYVVNDKDHFHIGFASDSNAVGAIIRDAIKDGIDAGEGESTFKVTCFPLDEYIG